MPKVSIIIPVYNTSKYLDKCIQTLINQTLKDIEIIFIDDGSTDDSLQKINSYADNDERIVVLTQKHKKQGAARNYGMSIAKGEYIGFVDSDGWVESDMFEKLYNKAIETSSDIIMCSIKTFDDETKKYIINTYNTLNIFDKKFFNTTFSFKDTLEFVFNISVSPCNKIYRKDFILNNDIKFPKRLSFEDNIFFFKSWLIAERISLINQALYSYRKYSNSTTGNQNDRNKIDIFKILSNIKKFLIKQGCYESLKKDYLRYKYETLKYWQSTIKNKGIKFIFFLKLLFVMPSVVFSPLIMTFKELKLLLILFFNRKNRIMLWGASFFLSNFLQKYKLDNANILGVIDKNKEKIGCKIGNLTIYSPDKIAKLCPDKIIISIVNFSVESKKYIEQYLQENYSKNFELELL